MNTKMFFEVNTNKYLKSTSYTVVRPASINNPKNNAVMFITENFIDRASAFLNVKECLIFWPASHEIPDEINEKNAVYECENPHLEYCKFFVDNSISLKMKYEEYDTINGANIAKTAIIGSNTIIMPGAYIGGDVEIGDNCEIGANVSIVGPVKMGNNVIIMENTVIGSRSMTTDRDENGHQIYMPQFGGIVIEDNVSIGANSVVSRGAIDNTVLHKGCKIDNMVFVSHNCEVGEETFVIGLSHMFGSSSVGNYAQISGGCILGNYVHIGDRTLLGMDSLATKSIPNDCVAYGIPAKVKTKK